MTFILQGAKCVLDGGAVGTGPGNVNKLWLYSSNDLLSAIDDSGYFNTLVDHGLTSGDLIFVSGDLDGTPASNLFIATVTAGVVTVTGLSTATLTFNARYVLNSVVSLTDGTTGHVVAPFAGTISNIRSVLLGGAVTTNDAIVTGKIGGVAITNGALTVTASGSAIGDMDTCTPTALNTVAAGDVISFTVSNTPGGSRTAQMSISVAAA